MRIKLKTAVTDYEGTPIPGQNGEGTLNYFDIFINALNGQIQGEILTAEKKSMIYQLSKKIYEEKEPNFTTEQLSLIKERVGLVYAPIVYGRVCDLIDGTGEPEVKEAQSAPEPTTDVAKKPSN